MIFARPRLRPFVADVADEEALALYLAVVGVPISLLPLRRDFRIAVGVVPVADFFSI